MSTAVNRLRDLVAASLLVVATRIASRRQGAQWLLRLAGGRGTDDLYDRAGWVPGTDVRTGLAPAPRVRRSAVALGLVTPPEAHLG